MKLLYFSIMINLSVIGQQNILNDSTKVYIYEAFFINSNGDTITKEITKYHFTSTKLNDQQFIKMYFFPDSTNSSKINYPNKKKEKKLSRIVYQLAKNDSIKFTINPFRDNQYIYCEAAPFPLVYKQFLIKNQKWTSKMIIPPFVGWGKLRGVLNSEYTVKEKLKINFKNEIINNCWLIESIGTHSKLGKSYNNFIYSEFLGLIEMKYINYDNSRICFKLINISKLEYDIDNK